MGLGGLIVVVIVIILFIVVVSLIASTIYVVQQQTVAIIERNGRFLALSNPGLHFKTPFVDRIAARESLKQVAMDVPLSALTKDNVTVQMNIGVQYQIIPEKVFDAHYKMQDPLRQIAQYVENVARAQVRKSDLGGVIGQINDISGAVEEHLSEVMSDKGYQIVAALVTEVQPEESVRKSLNAITASQNNRQAAINTAQGEQQALILRAEADKQTKILNGEGIAGERKAIIQGLKETVAELEAEGGIDANEAMLLILLIQYFDTQKAVAEASNTNTLFMNNSAGAVGDIQQQLIAVLRSNPSMDMLQAAVAPVIPAATNGAAQAS